MNLSRVARILASGSSTRRARLKCLQQARSLAELAWTNREQAEEERRLPDDVVDALRESGLVHLGNQQRRGGAEADPVTMLDIGRELARGSASLGWLFVITSFHTWYMAFSSEKLQQEVWGNDHTTFIADSFAPVGQVERVAGGYLLSGQWRFASGIEWAGWVAVGGMVPGPRGSRRPRKVWAMCRYDGVVVSAASVRDAIAAVELALAEAERPAGTRPADGAPRDSGGGILRQITIAPTTAACSARSGPRPSSPPTPSCATSAPACARGAERVP